MINTSSNLGVYRKKINEYQEILSGLFDKIYPVGSLYWSSKPTNPATLFGIGTWTQITDKFIYAAGSKTVNSTGGEETHTLTTAETPVHTHTRGTMNITGTAGLNCPASYVTSGNANAGALKGVIAQTSNKYAYSGGTYYGGNVVLNAADGWTGETSSIGGSGAHNNMPPYLVKYCWERTA